MVEVRRLFNETGLDVRVSATYSAKSAAWDVVEAALVGISNLRFLIGRCAVGDTRTEAFVSAEH